MRMPREDGPNAEKRVLKEMLPALRSVSETETGCMLFKPMLKMPVRKGRVVV